MIRDALSTELSAVANQVMPQAVGDAWRSTRFTVLFKRQEWKTPAPSCDFFDGVAQLEGEVLVRFYTDAENPLDLTALMIALREQPIVLRPDPAQYATGDYAVQLYFKPEETADMMYETVMFPVLLGPLNNCYVLRRNAIPVARVPGSVVDNAVTVMP